MRKRLTKKEYLCFFSKRFILLVLLISALIGIFILCWCLDSYSLDGPTSPGGDKVVVHIEDTGYRICGGKYYADVEILSGGFLWEDKVGHGSAAKVNSFVKSIKWEGNGTLRIPITSEDDVVIKREGAGWYIDARL